VDKGILSTAAESRTVGFIDIGTNAIRLLVARLVPNHSYSVVTAQREPVRLGEGEFVDRRLQPGPVDRAVLVCRRFAELARSHGAEEIVAVATSATREAVNKEEFLRRLREEAGLQVHVISGREEARLIYSGLTHFVHLGSLKAVFLDIGGGSTEVVVGRQHEYEYLDSIGVGAVRLTTKLPNPDETMPVSPERYQMLRQHVRHAAIHTTYHVKRLNADVAFGSSGTIQNLASVAARALPGGAQGSEDVLTLADLRRVSAMLCALDLDERRRVAGLNPDRADIIIGGAAILETLLEELGFSEIRVIREAGLREGLLVDYLAQGSHDLERLSVRERSVLQLGRTCNFDELHARNASRLALELFDSAREAGLHDYGEWERDLLSYAALLHDVGSFLSYSNHHLHSYYLIGNADLLGFYQQEIQIMALGALFHRKGLPSAKKPGYAALDKDARRLVGWFSLIVRLVEALDRSHRRVVKHARLSAAGPKGLVLHIEPSGDAQLELWGVETREKAVQKTLGRRLMVEVEGDPHPRRFAGEVEPLIDPLQIGPPSVTVREPLEAWQAAG
jgi:exopolyphosphatase/guanosine-5'-triphosphate,3'-diphosphate pyrophosphatase